MARSVLDLICASFVLWIYLIDNVATIQITGASGGVNLATGERPFRLDIDIFATSGAPYDLFILALIQLQNTNQSDPLSYFQIAGIHGYPMLPWDGVISNGSNYPGYCTHAAVAFPTWHRPYMALYEQALWNNAQTIARTYPISMRDKYQSAAAFFRIPYWDWAAKPYLPQAVSSPIVTINTPDGNLSVSNPLYAYTFRDSPQTEDFPATMRMIFAPETLRCWDQDPNRLQSNQTAANESLIAQAPTILSLTYQLFTSVTDYSSFSCTWPGGKANPGNNIENIHNSIHNSVGGYGHMAFPEVAAFDPIFFLHHANVDRIFAMWQALNPDSFIVPTVNPYGNYYESAGSVESGESSLAPFHSDNGTTMFTSNDVRATLRFGYTYPELVDWNISAADLASNLRTEINLLYNPTVAGTNSSRPATGRPLARAAGTAHAFHHVTFEEAKKLGMNNLEVQWNIDIRVQRYAYTSPFVIDFFMGDPEQNPKLRATAANLVGSHAQFIADDISKMFPTGAPQGLVQGHVSLSHTLAAGLNRGLIRDLSPQNVVPLLQEQLRWSARSVDGCDVDLSELSGLSITVSSKTVRRASSLSEFPTYGKQHFWPMVTHGKPGGERTFDL